MSNIDLSQLPCAGKRHYGSKSHAERGMKALLRENHGGRRARGIYHTYRCECGQWCVGTGQVDSKPMSKRSAPLDPERFGRGAEMFARAEQIAKERFPAGANASQLGAILREVLADGGVCG